MAADERRGTFLGLGAGARRVIGMPLCLHTRPLGEALYPHTRIEYGGIPACSLDAVRHARGRGVREVPRRRVVGRQEASQIPAFGPYGIFSERPIAMVALREMRLLRANAKSLPGRFAGLGESWSARPRMGMVRDDPSEAMGCPPGIGTRRDSAAEVSGALMLGVRTSRRARNPKWLTWGRAGPRG